MSTIEIELVGSEIRRSVRVPDDAAVEQLMPTLVMQAGDGSFGGAGWFLALEDGRHLDQHSDLSTLGVTSGTTVRLARRVPAIDPEGHDDPVPRDDRAPSERTGYLPERLGFIRRLTATAGALAGVATTPESSGAGAAVRARSMWEWTDHRCRLEWLLGRPSLRRTVIVGVCSIGPTGDGSRLTRGLLSTFAEHRGDRVVAIDGDPERCGLTQLTGHGGPTYSDVLDDVRRAEVDARFGSGPVVVGPDPAADTADEPAGRRVIERLMAQAGIIVVDCGPLGASPLTDLCDQVVVVTDRVPGAGVAEALRERDVIVVLSGAGLDLGAVDRTWPYASGVLAASDPGRDAVAVAAFLSHGWVERGIADIPRRLAENRPKAVRVPV